MKGRKMETSDSTDKIYPALLAAQKEFGGVEKGSHCDFGNYNYAKLEDYIKVAAPVLEEHKLAIVTGSNSFTVIDGRLNKDGKPKSAVSVGITLRLIHESGQWIEVQSVGEGEDVGDKSTYKALTGARKYGVAMLLGLVTTDDPDGGAGAKNKRQSAGASAPSMDDMGF